ncbi:MAG: hypothetical protein ABIB46_07000 [bacterium]
MNNILLTTLLIIFFGLLGWLIVSIILATYHLRKIFVKIEELLDEIKPCIKKINELLDEIKIITSNIEKKASISIVSGIINNVVNIMKTLGPILKIGNFIAKMSNLFKKKSK